MKLEDIAPLRMHRQHLWGTPLPGIEAVVGHLGAVQAQEFPVAKWSLAQRAKGVGEAALDRAFAEGRILRTHVLRPTWHFVLPEDIRWMLALTGPRVQRMMGSYDRQLELDAKLYAKTDRLIAKAVEGEHRMRKEIGDALERAKIPARGQRLGHIVLHAELEGIICSGAPRGKQQTYALLDDVAPSSKTLDRDEAVVELARRYFTSHGPATVKDFVWWSSTPTADARAALEELSKELQREEVDGRIYWFTSAPRRKAPASPRFDLVQVYDESIVAYTQSRDALLGSSKIPGVGALTLHAILLDGRLAGFWRLRAAKDSINVEVSPSRKLGAEERKALNSALERFQKFASATVNWVFTKLP